MHQFSALIKGAGGLMHQFSPLIRGKGGLSPNSATSCPTTMNRISSQIRKWNISSPPLTPSKSSTRRAVRVPFPMGILHKLVFLLSKLDPRNAQWRQRQINRVQNTITAAAERLTTGVIRESTIDELEGEIENINEAFERNALDYGRKLYLIENCIYGVDIQPIATQIAKLRFFISLIVEQRIDDTRENRGVRPLPNLETKFVAANTLLDVEKPEQMLLRNPEVDTKEQALAEVRRRHFTARTPAH